MAHSLRPTGRNGKYSDTLAASICDAVAQGYSLEAASAVAGIHSATVVRWRDSKPAFAAALKAADERAEQRMTGVVLGAIDQSWQAGAWWDRKSTRLNSSHRL